MIAIGRSRYLFDTIKHLVKKGYSFDGIVTDESYQEYDIKVSDFQELAKQSGIPCFVTTKANSKEIVDLIKDKSIQIAICANWKYTLPAEFLNLFAKGAYNFHIGSLPDYKGNATLNWAIINGEEYINANVHRMDAELDAGDIISRKPIAINSDTYISDIIREAEILAPALYEDALKEIYADHTCFLEKGSKIGLRCYPRLPEDSQIDWNMGIDSIYRLIKASSHPYNGAYTYLNGAKVKIWKAKPVNNPGKFLAVPGHIIAIDKTEQNITVACKDGLLTLQEIELENPLTPTINHIKSIRLRFKNIPDFS